MINLINPRSPFLTDEMVMPPLGIMYLSAVLKKAGIPSRIVDLSNNEPYPHGMNLVTGTTPQSSEMKKVPVGSYSVAGGPHASINPEDLLEKFSLVVIGEGESVIEKIIREKPHGILVAPRIKNLDSIPFPNRELAGNYHYLIDGKIATTAITSRGCNGVCSFCCKAVMNRGIYFRSAENVLAEMEEIKRLGYDGVMFYDDSIAMRSNRLVEICLGMKKLEMVWRCFVRSDQINFALAKIMADCGCREILLGIESGSNTILRNIRKNETAEQHKEAIRVIKKNGIRVKALMIVGLPGESQETVEESKNFILETRPDDLDVTILSVYPGCDIYRRPEKYELSFSSPIYYKGKDGSYSSSVSTPKMTAEEIIKARDFLHKLIK